MKLLRNLFVSCLAAWALLVFSGCETVDGGAPTGASGAGSAGTVASAPIGDDPEGAKIRAGEQLTIELIGIGTPQKIEQAVADDGTITLPLLPNRIQAAGKKDTELSVIIHDLYVPNIYKRLTVNIQRQNRYFFVGGQVKTPQQRLYTGDMTVIRAIKAAGDFTDYADKTHVRILRANGTHEVFDAKKAIKNPKYDQPIYPGDTVEVPLKLW